MFTFAAYLHNIDPFAIHISGNFGLRWYGLSYLAAFFCGYLFTRRITKVGITTLLPMDALDFVINVAIGVVVGGRLGYVVFYKPHLLVEFTNEVPFWGVFQLSGGGMSSHGGMIGVAVVVWFFAWRRRAKLNNPLKCPKCKYDLQGHVVAGNCPECGASFNKTFAITNHPRCRNCKQDLHNHEYQGECSKCGMSIRDSCPNHHWLHLLDFTALTATVGFFFGRIANFINAELVGRECSDDFALAVKYPQDMRSWSFEKLASLGDVVDQVGITAKEWTAALADRNIELIDTGIGRLIHAVQAGGDRANVIGETITPLLSAHHPSQLYAAILEGLAVFIVLAIVWMKPRKPGIIAGLFGIFYGIGRIINERWRTPDAHIANQEFDTYGITRGQLLSVVLVVLGIVVTMYCAKKNTPRMGGWLRVKKTDLETK